MDDELLHPEDDAARLLARGSQSKHIRFVMAALGAIPWVGSIITAAATLAAEQEQGRVNEALFRWVQQHEERFGELQRALLRITKRVDGLGEDASDRLNDEAFTPLVERAFRGWDRAQTKDKRRLFERLLANAAATSLSDDDVVRLFIDWIDRYDEAHFRIIAAVYKYPGITRLGIWQQVGRTTEIPREDSSDADLFRMLMHDLSTGRVVRQHREVSPDGRFYRKPPRRRRSGPASPYLKSSFNDEERHQLSELGADFVRYVLTEAVTRIDLGGPNDPED